jgi:hypothetical protein
MKFSRLLMCVIGILAVALPVMAQVPTGTLSGRVDDGTASLPGVLVTITSPALQGTKTATTSVNGDYIFSFLPPGEYKVKFELQGFQTQETTIKISAAQTATLNATMPQATVAEEVTVTVPMRRSPRRVRSLYDDPRHAQQAPARPAEDR